MIDPLKQEQAIALIMVRQNVSWLAAVRIHKNMSRTDAAKMLNVTPNALTRIEKKQISAHMKSRMAEIYGCPEALLVCPSWMNGLN
ncbi:helix-turn-helix transcriptional regulator, partial [Salmonella enterica subsp. enterica serovar Livingstone]|nr:XRE family transcriptional regulator [Salmonella enterica subsp. enterica serovar Livingstone]ECY0612190.1 helix-turn-helix transcriptional regulator [Salmonella enterica subsp. enterica serovar Livingstone]